MQFEEGGTEQRARDSIVASDQAQNVSLIQFVTEMQLSGSSYHNCSPGDDSASMLPSELEVPDQLQQSDVHFLHQVPLKPDRGCFQDDKTIRVTRKDFGAKFSELITQRKCQKRLHKNSVVESVAATQARAVSAR